MSTFVSSPGKKSFMPYTLGRKGRIAQEFAADIEPDAPKARSAEIFDEGSDVTSTIQLQTFDMIRSHKDGYALDTRTNGFHRTRQDCGADIIMAKSSAADLTCSSQLPSRKDGDTQESAKDLLQWPDGASCEDTMDESSDLVWTGVSAIEDEADDSVFLLSEAGTYHW